MQQQQRQQCNLFFSAARSSRAARRRARALVTGESQRDLTRVGGGGSCLVIYRSRRIAEGGQRKSCRHGGHATAVSDLFLVGSIVEEYRFRARNHAWVGYYTPEMSRENIAIFTCVTCSPMRKSGLNRMNAGEILLQNRRQKFINLSKKCCTDCSFIVCVNDIFLMIVRWKSTASN